MLHFFISIIIYSFIGSQITVEKQYHKEYYQNGSIKAEGWKINDKKIDYWYEYYPNGQVAKEGHFYNNKKNGYWFFYTSDNKLAKEGHFIDNNAEKWWIIYDIASANKKTQITRKFQYRKNKKNGYCLLYKGKNLFKAEKYKDDKKTGEWTDIASFKRDNPNASL